MKIINDFVIHTSTLLIQLSWKCLHLVAIQAICAIDVGKIFFSLKKKDSHDIPTIQIRQMARATMNYIHLAIIGAKRRRYSLSCFIY